MIFSKHVKWLYLAENIQALGSVSVVTLEAAALKTVPYVCVSPGNHLDLRGNALDLCSCDMSWLLHCTVQECIVLCTALQHMERLAGNAVPFTPPVRDVLDQTQQPVIVPVVEPVIVPADEPVEVIAPVFVAMDGPIVDIADSASRGG